VDEQAGWMPPTVPLTSAVRSARDLESSPRWNEKWPRCDPVLIGLDRTASGDWISFVAQERAAEVQAPGRVRGEEASHKPGPRSNVPHCDDRAVGDRLLASGARLTTNGGFE